jgi:uroporphyrinogen-III decarboxylase
MVYGPFTVAGQVAGEQEVLRSTVERPQQVYSLLEKTLALALSYARLLLETGVEVPWVSDPLASLLPPRGFWEFAGQYLARLLEAHPGGPTALHTCGDTSPIIVPMLATGADGISFDQCLDLLALEDALPPEVPIIGNPGPMEVLELAEVQEVEAQTSDLAEVMGLLPNFCLSRGCAPPPTAPLANIARFLEACQKQGGRVLGFSAFSTGARKELNKVIQLSRQPGQQEVAVVVGGAAVNQQVAASVGADGYVHLVKDILAEQAQAGRG